MIMIHVLYGIALIGAYFVAGSAITYIRKKAEEENAALRRKLEKLEAENKELRETLEEITTISDDDTGTYNVAEIMRRKAEETLRDGEGYL